MWFRKGRGFGFMGGFTFPFYPPFIIRRWFYQHKEEYLKALEEYKKELEEELKEVEKEIEEIKKS